MDVMLSYSMLAASYPIRQQTAHSTLRERITKAINGHRQSTVMAMTAEIWQATLSMERKCKYGCIFYTQTSIFPSS